MSLRGDRVISSIPKEISDEKSQCPHLKDKEDKERIFVKTNEISSKDENWVYPSPKMFWEAMNRKGTLPDHLKDTNSPKTQEELDWIVTIHNVVNEQCWQEIRKWEKFRHEGCVISDDKSGSIPNLRLQRFLGRPDDISPRAWFKSTILGYRRPFDRHDWYVRDENGQVLRRYVIDFYSAASKNDANALHLDVRPALDSIDSLKLRIRKFICDQFNF